MDGLIFGILRYLILDILGDPGADSGDEGKSKFIIHFSYKSEVPGRTVKFRK